MAKKWPGSRLLLTQDMLSMSEEKLQAILEARNVSTKGLSKDQLVAKLEQVGCGPYCRIFFLAVMLSLMAYAMLACVLPDDSWAVTTLLFAHALAVLLSALGEAAVT